MSLPLVIADGAGKGYSAQVGSDLRLRTSATTRTASENATIEGDSYNLNTGIVTLTNTADTPVMYVKNNEDRNLHIQTIVVILGASASGTGESKITIISNPTVGTIITSTPTDIDISVNRNFGSTNELTADAFKGAIGDTMTDGDDYIQSLISAGSRVAFNIDTLIPKGKTIGVKIQPPASNTSMAIEVAFVCRLETNNG